ncbi:MAG: ATP-dependent DNA helicase RecG [Gammaproteobacteria bacterium]|nr:MAG: ATP-dependent DNA helicase RecG [Gammaproteobacteria bacterium]
MDKNTLSQPVTELKGVGNKVAERLQKLGIWQVQDLLFHLPLRYQDRTRLLPLGSLRSHQEGLVEGSVKLSQVKFGRRRSLLCHIEDGTGSLVLRFFHFSKVQQQQLKQGALVRCFGEVRTGPSSLEMVHPEYQIIADDKIVPVDRDLTPIYPTTEGVHQIGFRKLIKQALTFLNDDQMLPELLPQAARLHDVADFSLVEALLFVHQPPPDVDVELLMERRHPTQRRLAYEELLAQHLGMRRVRSQAQQHKAPILKGDGKHRQALLEQLPFPLTGAQQRVVNEILVDMEQDIPMQRLVQGDVGSGKTVVAALAVLEAVSAGFQAVMMAPTELLAEQHLQTFKTWLEPLGIPLGWCAGKQTAAQRKQVVEQLKEGHIRVAIGTHALFQDEVVFNNLGLVVIDEQHRFGVHQRLALRDKGRHADSFPHQLVMTATPIPRTLAMTAYADLNVSVIDELPPGRSPVTTVVIPDARRGEIVKRVHIACQENRQVYWVCTLIEESEHLQCQAAEDAATDLQQALPDLRIALVHGRMKAAEKELVMQAFKAGDVDLLVATTVIEVGVDIPNASLMVIENAERLGLAQLHQLRGRVGRGSVQSHCVLMYHAPLSKNGQARLSCLRDTNDGFMIAQRDLELRGPGELLGTRQTGLPQFRVADVMQDQDLINVMSQAADQFLVVTPENNDDLIARWFGHKVDFGHV